MLTYATKKLLSGFGKIKGSNELGYLGFQQHVFQIARFVCTKKAKVNKYNTEFAIAYVVDIFFWNQFLTNPTFIIPDFEEEDEGDTWSPLDIRIIGNTKISRMCWIMPTNLDEDMDDVKKFDGTSS